MRRVIIESPLSGDFERNIRYARLCMLDCLQRGEAPFASHLLYTQVWDDLKPGDREAGIRAGLAWQLGANLIVAYVDLGISEGMQRAIDLAPTIPQHVERRNLPPELFRRLDDPRFGFTSTPGAI